ncbi:MAG TPA: RDD family protein, partial [Negativicutes bacterium]|nr:RDD family protein [Negativicutes bacterium]
MNEYSLLSPERVQLKLNIVGIGSRFAACFIDSIFQSILLVFLIAGAISLHVSGLIRWEMQNFRDYLLLAILLLLGFAIL